jgi:hypothetical protein
MINERLKFPAGISLGRNFTATKFTCGAAAVFQVICGNPHVMLKKTLFLPSDAFLTECEYTNQMIIKTILWIGWLCRTLRVRNDEQKTAERHCERSEATEFMSSA